MTQPGTEEAVVLTETYVAPIKSFGVASYEEWTERGCLFSSKPDDQETMIMTSEALELFS